MAASSSKQGQEAGIRDVLSLGYAVQRNLVERFGPSIARFLIVFLAMGWALRQFGTFVPAIGRLLFTDGKPPPPPPAENFLRYCAWLCWCLGTNAAVGVLALGVLALVTSLRTVWHVMGPIPDLAKRYGAKSWAVVIMLPNDPLGVALCRALTKTNLNLMVITEAGMREFCTGLQQGSSVQVQLFEMSLSDGERISRAWANYDLAIVVFVSATMPLAAYGSVHHESTKRIIDHGTCNAHRIITLAVPKLLSRVPHETEGSRRGALICATSLCGAFPLPGRTVQSAGDAFVIGFASALSAEVASQGLHVLCAPCAGLVPNTESKQMDAVAHSVLVALSRGQHLTYGPFRNAAQAWVMGVLSPQMRLWLFGAVWDRFCNLYKKTDVPPTSSTDPPKSD